MRIPGSPAFLLLPVFLPVNIPMILPVVLPVVLPVAFAVPAAAAHSPKATCSIEFSGSSSVKDFGGTIPPVVPAVEPSATSAGKWNIDMAFPVASMNTANASGQATLRQVLGAGDSRYIQVSLRDIDPQITRDRSELTGTLTMAGTTRAFVAKLQNWQQNQSDVSFDATASISLAEFGLVPPAMLGLVRVRDEVAVTAHVVVESADRLLSAISPENAAPRKS